MSLSRLVEKEKTLSEEKAFARAYNELPAGALFDGHKTVKDLVWISQIEIDLHEEGQDGCLSLTIIKRHRRFVNKWRWFNNPDGEIC